MTLTFIVYHMLQGPTLNKAPSYKTSSSILKIWIPKWRIVPTGLRGLLLPFMVCTIANTAYSPLVPNNLGNSGTDFPPQDRGLQSEPPVFILCQLNCSRNPDLSPDFPARQIVLPSCIIFTHYRTLMILNHGPLSCSDQNVAYSS